MDIYQMRNLQKTSFSEQNKQRQDMLLLKTKKQINFEMPVSELLLEYKITSLDDCSEHKRLQWIL